MKVKVLGLLCTVLLLCALPFAVRGQQSDFETAAAQLRCQLEAREPEITVTFASETPCETLAMDLFWVAVEHTGVPTQGDYLRWHLDKLDYTEDHRMEGDINIYTLTYTPVYFSTAEEETHLDRAVQQLLGELELDYVSDYHKARAIYEYICENVSYDAEAEHFSAYEAMVEKRAVCQGFSTLFYRLALELGLDCRVISGQANGVHHGWNIVKVRDKFYNLDATWDSGSTRYTRFLKGSDYFYFHIPDEAFLTEEFLQEYSASKTNYILTQDCGKEHRFTAYRPNKDATCTADSTETAVCENCEVTDTRAIPGTASGHSYGAYTPNGDATMYRDGTKTARCSRCNSTDTQTDPGSRLPRQGWLLEEGYWYYYRNDRPSTGWLLDGTQWYFLKSDGIMATGWIKTSGVWYYLQPSGAMATGWVKLENTWYYLRPSGAMATGWVKLENTWYYLQPSGAMATGWVKLENTWYYLQPSGAMVTGTAVINGRKHYFDQNGTWIGV